jgi:hypothetical protein
MKEFLKNLFKFRWCYKCGKFRNVALFWTQRSKKPYVVKVTKGFMYNCDKH